jgi:hypothetical protein
VKNCRLPHVDRAGQLRQQSGKTANAARQAVQGQSGIEVGDESDVSSDEEDYDEIDSDDLDSDGLEDELMLDGDDSSNSLAQQENFVRL